MVYNQVMYKSNLIQLIEADPVGFIWNPLKEIDRVDLKKVEEAIAYFVDKDDFFLIDNERYWPFWHDQTLSKESEPVIRDFLVALWNAKAMLLDQTGIMKISKIWTNGAFYFFECDLNVSMRSNSDIRRDKLVIAFDRVHGGFYSKDARIKYEYADPDCVFRYVESIDGSLKKIDSRTLSTKRPIKALVVLDRHIGDSLSLFSIHIKYLALHPHVQLTIDMSRCPLLRTASKVVLNKMLPKSGVAHWSDVPLDYGQFDVIFDPYDVVAGVWPQKFSHDSAHVGIVSGLELLKARLKRTRRSILDVHAASLARFPLISKRTVKTEFIRYKDNAVRRKKPRSKIITIFPFGLTPDRKYPPDRLREVIMAVCADPHAKVVLSGSYEDTPGIVDSIIGELGLVGLRETGRVVLQLNKTFDEVIRLMLASDVVVSMDSGPLHIARMLRLNPIALYTSKVNDKEQMKDFLWFVDDGTARCLVPKKGDTHVLPEEVVRTIRGKENKC